MACPPSEDSDQPGHLPSLIRVFAGCPGWSESSLSAWRKLGSLATHWAHSKDSDQTGQMPRLIWVFAGRTCHYVGFVTRWLIFVTERNIKMVISESFCLCTVFDCGLHMGYISFKIKEKSQCCHHHHARLSFYVIWEIKSPKTGWLLPILSWGKSLNVYYI